MAIEIVDLPIKNGGSFHSYVKLPEGNRKISKSSNQMDNLIYDGRVREYCCELVSEGSW